MKSVLAQLGLVALAAVPLPALAADSLPSPSGEVRITGGEYEMKSVTVGGESFPLGDLRASLVDQLGNLILVAIYTGGTACPATYAWLNTTPGSLGLTDSFGTCSDLYELSHDSETVTLTMPSFNASEGKVAFVYDGRQVARRVLGLESSETAQQAQGDAEAWIGESPYEYLTAQETEAGLIGLFGWEDLDQLRNTLVVGSQEMVVDGEWVVGSGCRPHMCDTDFAVLALHRGTGEPIAAIKQDGQPPRLLGEPAAALPVAIRNVMVSR